MLANYYQENIKRLQKNLVKDTKILKRKEKKEKNQQYGRESLKNFSENEKQKLVGYRKYYRIRSVLL